MARAMRLRSWKTLCVGIIFVTGAWDNVVPAQQSSPTLPPRRPTGTAPAPPGPARRGPGTTSTPVSPPRGVQQPRLDAQDPPPQGAVAGPQPAPQAFNPQAILPPPFQLSPDEQTRVDQILQIWEKRNDKIDKFRCEFTRSTFDPVWGPKEHTIPKTKSDGEIRYWAPDRGLFDINGKNVKEFTGLDEKKGPQYAATGKEFGEKWICDGDSVYQFDASQKLLKQMKLPEEMRGKAIADGPLPFLFGASAEKLKARYYIREIPKPTDVTKEYWLEAFPRHAIDAVEFRSVRIAMDKDFHPKKMEVIGHPDANGNYLRELYEFRNVRINNPIDNLKALAGQLINTSTPMGWKKVVENYGEPGAPPAQAAQTPEGAPRVGARPEPPKR